MDNDPFVAKEEDHVWQKPSVDQMAASLLSTLIVKPVQEPLAPEHCSLALRLLEAYRERNIKITELEKELARERETRQRQSEDYEGLTSEWENQQDMYRGEIKTGTHHRPEERHCCGSGG